MCLIHFVGVDGNIRRTLLEIGSITDIVRRLHKCGKEYAARKGCMSRMQFLDNGIVDEDGEMVMVEVSV